MKTEGFLAECPMKLKVYYTGCHVNNEGLLYSVSHEYWMFTIQGVPWMPFTYGSAS